MTNRTLTSREAEVATLISDGYRDQEIADKLQLSVRTVHTYIARAFLKAGVRTRRDLAVWWIAQEEAAS